MDILDVGCGVGRWSLQLAKRRNRVLGIDLSPRMVELAQGRARERGLDCEFAVGDLISFELHRQFDLILAVTVLQHVTDDTDLRMAVHNLARHLKPSGSLVLLDAAPSRQTSRCDSPIFRTRKLSAYTDLLRDSNFTSIDIIGVDMAPLRPILLPAIKTLPNALGKGLVTATALLSLPTDLIASRYFPRACWHKVIVAKRAAVISHAG
jgi:2-polyprenyl-3-methyl-5-hydroxy-6-metoxy-1,4-benzoquinol methylase